MIKIHYKRAKLLVPDIVLKYIDLLFGIKRILSAKKYALKDDEKISENEPFFIVGSGRSGSTLLRAMLCAHPNIGIPPENGALRNVYRAYVLYGGMPWEVLVEHVLVELYKAESFMHWDMDRSELGVQLKQLPDKHRTLNSVITVIYQDYLEKQFVGASLWGDKTPLNTFNLTRINTIFPNARYIHILRDGRDVVASYKKAGLRNVRGVIEAAYFWKDAVSQLRKLVRKGIILESNLLQVKYENLVKNPKKELKRICIFLNIEYRDEMLRHDKSIKKMADVHLLHHSNTQNKICDSSIGKWKQNLTDKETAKVTRILKKQLLLNGYKYIS